MLIRRELVRVVLAAWLPPLAEQIPPRNRAWNKLVTDLTAQDEQLQKAFNFLRSYDKVATTPLDVQVVVALNKAEDITRQIVRDIQHLRESL